MKHLQQIFVAPLRLLQLEGYNTVRWVRNMHTVPHLIKHPPKVPFVWTMRIRLYLALTSIVVLGVCFLDHWLKFLVILCTPFFVNSMMNLGIQIVEWIVRGYWNRILHHHAVPHRIAIVGSYGKTSTKQFLKRLLQQQFEVIASPDSFNTTLGIARFLEAELTRKTEVMIIEMDAYKLGEIRSLCRMIQPTMTIITAIGPQHLERFGSIENITQSVLEATEGVSTVIRGDQIDNPDPLTRQATHLFGRVHYLNLTTAIQASKVLGILEQTVRRTLPYLTPPDHRLSMQILKNQRCTVIVDNAFSSNRDGFLHNLQNLAERKGKNAVITPGLVELGKQSISVHQELATLLKHLDLDWHLIKNKNTVAMMPYLSNVTLYDRTARAGDIIARIQDKYNTILIENDLPDQY